ncbi:phosphopantetheine-binding protein [Streptomyces sp. NPDC006514]|uniref:phosphopantetheine-binding protein n=1 Tax=Streptomyces sp. NPDC006514 TaxID=3154308 RepID=UPI0033BA814B
MARQPEAAPEEDVTAEKSFVDDLGADEADLLELWPALQEEFETEFEPHVIEKVLTVQSAVDLFSSARV